MGLLPRRLLAPALLLTLPRPVAAIQDPVALINQMLMLVIMIVLVVLLVKYRSRVLMFFTGDDRVHVDVNSTIWYTCCTCCRMCNGDWTRYLSACLCFWHKGLRGRNLKRVVGQVVGVVPIPVQISNIVVGDLPTYRSGDFFLSIELGHNPAQITSLAEDANPKVVQFPETILLRVRASPAEASVRFVVKELHTLGNTEICECFVNPLMMVKWNLQEKGPMRFRMEPCDRRSEFTFPPWILMELRAQQEYGHTAEFDVRVNDFKTGSETQLSAPNDFKTKYRLLNTYGMRSEEPDELKVGELDRMKRRKGFFLVQIFSLLTLVSVLFITSRVYCFSCYKEYQKIAVLDNAGLEFPVQDEMRNFFTVRCDLDGSPTVELIFGTVQKAGSEAMSKSMDYAKSAGGNTTNQLMGSLSSAVDTAGNLSSMMMANSSVDPRCIAPPERVQEVCNSLPIGARDPGLPWEIPGLFGGTLPCHSKTCDLTTELNKWDTTFILFVIICIIASIVIGCVFDKIIKRMQDNLYSDGDPRNIS